MSPRLSSSLGFRCERCGRCCRNVRVPLTEADLRRLVVASGLSADKIVEWCAPEEIDMEGEPETFVHVREGRRIMVLAHVDGACCLLQERSCLVYTHRPAACAAFPFFIESDGAAVGRLPGPCGLGSSLSPERSEQSHSAPRDLRAASATLAHELETHAWRVQAWNRRQRRRLRLHRSPESRHRFLEYVRRDW